jgi:solute:Na+ symporter, SSS family
MIALLIISSYLSLLVLLGGVASRLQRGTANDFLMASQTIGPFLLLMSLFGTTMTAFALVGSTAEAFRRGTAVYGMLASGSGIMHSACFFFVGVKLWKLGQQFHYKTQVEFFRDRLQSEMIGVVLFPVLVALVVPYLLVGILGGGEVVSQVTAGAFSNLGWFADDNHGVPAWLASLVLCLVVLSYVFFGGMRGTAWANTFQTVFFMVLGIATFVVIARGIGDGGNLWESLRQATEGVPADKLGTAAISKTSWLGYLLIPLSIGMFPHVFQHWLTARSAATFKLPIIGQPICIMIVWAPCVLIGIWAASPSVNLPPDIRDNQVLGTMVALYAGPVLGGLLTAGILAAVMSSLDSQFLCLGTIFSRDIVIHYGGAERFTDRQAVLLARIFIVLIVAVTYLLSLVMPTGVFALGVWCFAGFAGLFPLIVAALYWRRLTAPAAIAAVVGTMLGWLILFWHSGFGTQRGYMFPSAPLPGQEPSWLASALPPLPPVILLTILSTLILVAVSLVTRPPDKSTLARFFKT